VFIRLSHCVENAQTDDINAEGSQHSRETYPRSRNSSKSTREADAVEKEEGEKRGGREVPTETANVKDKSIHRWVMPEVGSWGGSGGLRGMVWGWGWEELCRKTRRHAPNQQ
jgi:hypothetical protein